MLDRSIPKMSWLESEMSTSNMVKTWLCLKLGARVQWIIISFPICSHIFPYVFHICPSCSRNFPSISIYFPYFPYQEMATSTPIARWRTAPWDCSWPGATSRWPLRPVRPHGPPAAMLGWLGWSMG